MRYYITGFFVFFCFMLAIIDMKQIFDYKILETEVTILEKKQLELLNRHKQLLTSISVMSSLSRLEEVATQRLDLSKLNTQQLKKILLLPSPSKGNT